MVKKVNNAFRVMMALDIMFILLGFGAFYHKAFLFFPILGIVNFVILNKKKNNFIESYNDYKCEEEENGIMPDALVKFLYYGKKHLYFTAIHSCNIIPYEGLEVEKATKQFVNLINKSVYKVNKNVYKKMRLDISQVSIDNFQEYLFKNIEEAKNMDIASGEFQSNVKERENKQKSLIPIEIIILLCFNTFGILIPVAITAQFNERIAALILLGMLIIATIITIPVTFKYFKKLFKYKKEVEEANGSIAQFYKTYFRLALLPIVIILFLWFVTVVMVADVWFDTWLF